MITSLKRKKYQRALNKKIRAINDTIKKDWLWDGRFTISQIDSPVFEIYDDHSGANYWVHLLMYDNETGQAATCVDSVNNLLDWSLSRWVNQVITEEFRVWETDPIDPYEKAYAAGRVPPNN